MRRTKIVATLGPATAAADAVDGLVAAGVDVFRLNFSHGTRETHAAAIARVRDAAGRHDRQVAILQDLSGPKIRTGPLRGGQPVPLRAGDTLHIVAGDMAGGEGRVSTAYAALPRVVRPGDTLLLDDGRIQLKVEEAGGGEIRTTVVDGGVLGEFKGINAPGILLPAAGLTAKDRADLEFGVSAGVDFMALSFVQTPADLQQARAALASAGAPRLPLVAKLERPEAVARLDEILAETDAVMVARGDLGLELPLERVPRVQKETTARGRALGIPVIVATQVLESMRTEPRPTRAEVSDAANAVGDGVDAIMLAGETAVGMFPLRAVQTLDAIIRDAETMPPAAVVPLEGPRLLGGHGRAICEAAITLAARSNAAAIVAITRGGKTARLLSALRPRAPIYAATDDPAIARRLALAWGVVPIVADLRGDVSEAAARLGGVLVARGAIPSASTVVLVSITPDLAAGPSNVLKLQRVI
jgi:pyruvate kinase